MKRRTFLVTAAALVLASCARAPRPLWLGGDSIGVGMATAGDVPSVAAIGVAMRSTSAVLRQMAKVPAGANSKNAGGLYLKDGGTYLGKIVDGKLTASWEAQRMEGLLDRIASAMVDPVEAARAYGKRTGHCSCCGRLLTDPVSVERGIGPICEANFF